MQVEDSAQGRITRWAMNRNTNTHHAMRIRVLSLLAALMLALGVLPAALAEDGQYGYVNFDNVRFRKQANDTVVWDKLNNGWVCKILGTKSAGGVNYYYVSTNLPAYLDREYYGYISQQYITLMSEAEADAWQKQGGNATVLGGSTSSSGDSGTDTASPSGMLCMAMASAVRAPKCGSAAPVNRVRIPSGRLCRSSARPVATALRSAMPRLPSPAPANAARF